ncbi:MAG: DUF11 domain-containing protein [Anaerolineae bacterium]|nr:DUF11 domain-containing protein [Anaerolineae bacterium]
MSSSKRPLVWGLLVGLLVIAWAWAVIPLQVTGAPPSQIDVPTRPPVSTLTPTPIPGTEPGSPSGVDPTKRKIDLALIVDKTQASPGDLLKYQLQVSNVAGQKATNIWLTCDLPDEVEIATYSTTRGTIHRYGQRLSVEMGMFEPSYESFWVEIEAQIKDEVAAGTRLIHHANLTSDQAGGGERDAVTSYELQVETLVIGGGIKKAETSPLPSTGHSALSAWVVLGFVALIAAAALLEGRERIRLSN